MQGKIPLLSPHKELQFPEISPQLANLKILEERILLASWIGFIQIRDSFVDRYSKDLKVEL